MHVGPKSHWSAQKATEETNGAPKRDDRGRSGEFRWLPRKPPSWIANIVAFRGENGCTADAKVRTVLAIG